MYVSFYTKAEIQTTYFDGSHITTNYDDKVAMGSMTLPEIDLRGYFTITETQSNYDNEIIINASKDMLMRWYFQIHIQIQKHLIY